MAEPITYVGIDAHARTLQVAVLVTDSERTTLWELPNESRAIERLARKLEREHPGPIECCYEAGPCGYPLQRQLTRGRIRCRVIAPSLIPRKPGERIKTDRRDARKLAELLRADLLTAVIPPTPAQEAVRDLCRARDDARDDLHRARMRFTKFLLRRGLHYAQRNWTKQHTEWLDSLRWSDLPEQPVVENYRLAIAQVAARIVELEHGLQQLAATLAYARPVAALRCFRGIDTVCAMSLLAELHDVRRFRSAKALMAYVGVIPREHTSGDRTRRGPITKLGNPFLRRLLVEAAWHYRHEARIGRPLRLRRLGQPAAIIAVADKAQHRLCRRYRQMRARLKPTPQITVAIARELAGFIWAVLQMPDAQP
jgi:transposase